MRQARSRAEPAARQGRPRCRRAGRERAADTHDELWRHIADLSVTRTSSCSAMCWARNVSAAQARRRTTASSARPPDEKPANTMICGRPRSAQARRDESWSVPCPAGRGSCEAAGGRSARTTAAHAPRETPASGLRAGVRSAPTAPLPRARSVPPRVPPSVSPR
jgi:hypothetical protein